MEAYSDATNTTYESFDALINAEANGWVVICIITSPKQTWPAVIGPFATKEEANRERNRLREKYKRESWKYPDQTYKWFARPAWKPERELQ